jgi:hypothetical protein
MLDTLPGWRHLRVSMIVAERQRLHTAALWQVACLLAY